MALSSMTGFARGQGAAGAYGWVWEIRSVNAKGLDLRLRLPPGWDAALADLTKMRRHEGEAIGRVLGTRLREITALVARAEAAPGRKPDAIKARLAEQVANLLDASERFDADRLHQEAILMASKADVREELDRLVAHVAQASKMLRDGGAVGRRLDFLAQELNRETNTLCAKANDLELTNIGLELKSLV